ncbi:ribonuclease Z [Sporolactobacillus spathodeae]|uniref:Ribonuclease Z n=1 Tax=Sporolactobacillus spathodeae TaxID=1465502 RepID=A0ABS2Q9N3_9BACL|nr:ribonuclease Z [Sporolactobacillus spathodeae]MBM7657879.1 ribonuclease Z [Sporolactobacillus spathodeae]
MDFTFLGTGAGMPAKERNVSSLAVSFPEYNGELWLFDCGEGTQRQILYTSVRLPKLSVVFITHLHGDHIYGLPGVLGSRSFQGADQELCLVGPVGLKQFVETTLNVSKTHLHYPVKIIEIEKPGIIYENSHFKVEARELDHGIQCFGYRLIEKNQPGELLIDKIRALGIPEGPIYQQFKEATEVKLPDGRILPTAPFLGPEKKGRHIAVIGDTRPCASVRTLAQDADLMIHEATFSHDESRHAHDYHHSTSVQAAQQALEANVSALILTHLSSRYQKAGQKALLDEARAVFRPTLLASDLWHYSLKRQSR